jgi:hypothetical protein
MMVDIRCSNALHARFNPDTFELDVKCRDCTRAQKRPIYHRVPLLDVAEMVKRGEVVGICEPTDPRFVHWKVTGS